MPGNRKLIRLKDYNYAQEGAYYVTICVADHKSVFGNVKNGEMVLNECGEIADKCWNEIPKHFPNVELDEYIVMTNHVHGIINIRAGTACRARTTMVCFGKPVTGSLSTIIRSFKSAVTKQINQKNNTPGTRLWQRNYYEHVIRSESDMNRIREYIINNPAGWEQDEYYAEN